MTADLQHNSPLQPVTASSQPQSGEDLPLCLAVVGHYQTLTSHLK